MVQPFLPRFWHPSLCLLLLLRPAGLGERKEGNRSLPTTAGFPVVPLPSPPQPELSIFLSPLPLPTRLPTTFSTHTPSPTALCVLYPHTLHDAQTELS